MMEYYGVSLSTQVSDKPKKGPPNVSKRSPKLLRWKLIWLMSLAACPIVMGIPKSPSVNLY